MNEMGNEIDIPCGAEQDTETGTSLSNYDDAKQ